MCGRFATPAAELRKFDLALYFLLVFAGVIITPFADGATKGDEIVSVFNLCHTGYRTISARELQLGIASHAEFAL